MNNLTLGDMLTHHAHLKAAARAKHTSRVDQLQAANYVNLFVLGYLAHQLASSEDGRKAWQDTMRATARQFNLEEGDR